MTDLLETLTDNFDDNSLSVAKWQAKLVINFSLDETNQQIQIGTHTSGGIGSLISVDSYSLVGSYGSVKLTSGGNQDLTSVAFYYILDDLLGHDYYWKLQTDTLKAFSEGVELDSVAYVSTTHTYLRIREASGTVYFDYSADQISWTNFASDASPVGSLDALYVVLSATADAETYTTTIIIDSFNVATTGNTILVAQNASCAVTADNIAVVPSAITLTVANATCATTSQSPAIVAHNYLEVADATSAVTSEAPASTAHARLTVADASCAVTADSIALEASCTIILVFSATCAVTADNITLNASATSMVIADAACAMSADNAVITYNTGAPTTVLAVQDATSAATIDTMALLIHAYIIAVADATCATCSNNVVLLRTKRRRCCSISQLITLRNISRSF